MTYLVLDLETVGKETFKRFCNPLDPRHWVYVAASRASNEEAAHSKVFETKKVSEDVLDYFLESRLSGVQLLVNHNLKFDLLWLWKYPSLQAWLKNGGVIWDTLTVEYLLRGQDIKLAKKGHGELSLDSLAPLYGGKVKDDRLKEFWDQGMMSDQIPLDILLPYAEGDTINTELVYLGQLEKAKKMGTLPLIKTYMEHYLAVTEMEFNGMHVDLENVQQKAQNYTQELDLLQLEGKEIYGVDNIGSPAQVSMYLFGEKRSVDEAVLLSQLDNSVGFCEHVLKYRHVQKMLKTYTYYEEQYKRDNVKKGIVAGDIKRSGGLKSLVMPHTGCVHTEFNTSVTKTGRLSSKNPNLQNCPPEIIDVFNSRYDNGKIIEADFSQLEVCILAYLSQDPVLIKEIEDGYDMHRANATFIYHKSAEEVTKAERKIAKFGTFGITYGQSPKAFAATHGLEEEAAALFFQKWYKKYAGVAKWHESLIEEVRSLAKLISNLIPIKNWDTGQSFTQDGEWMFQSIVNSCTGKRYAHYDKASVRTAGDEIRRRWHLPDIKNYPVQGLAADVVALCVGHLYRNLTPYRGRITLINEVHDAILLDVDSDHVKVAVDILNRVMGNGQEYFEKRFGMRFNVPLRVDISIGDNWKQCKG
jgi:DNA polymerase-1